MLVKLDRFPRDRDEKKQIFELPPPRLKFNVAPSVPPNLSGHSFSRCSRSPWLVASFSWSGVSPRIFFSMAEKKKRVSGFSLEKSIMIYTRMN